MAAPAPRLLAFALLAASACAAHAPAARAPSVEAVWPRPPAQPRIRLRAIFPDPDEARPAISWWRRVLAVITGVDGPEDHSPILARPFGLAATPDGAFVVADPVKATVLRVAPSGAASSVDCAGHPWEEPMGVAFAPDGALLVADAGAGAVLRIALDGKCTRFGEGALERPTAVTASTDRVFVADPPRHRVVVFDLAGEPAGHFGERGEGEGQLLFPSSLARTQDGRILVADALNSRVAVWGADGRWLGAMGGRGSGEPAVSRPKGVACDDAGRVYVSDAERDIIAVFLPDGGPDVVLGASGSEPGEFAHPAGLAASGGRLFVADSLNGRVQVFEVLRGTP